MEIDLAITIAQDWVNEVTKGGTEWRFLSQEEKDRHAAVETLLYWIDMWRPEEYGDE